MKKLSDLKIKYAALLIVEPDGSAYICKPHWEKAVRVEIRELPSVRASRTSRVKGKGKR